MIPAQFQVRRATLEDLDPLRVLWKESCFALKDLEKRLMEFQVVVNERGEIQGAIGLHMLVQQGWIHSEAYFHPEIADVVRPTVWQRLQVQAQNHGLLRFWTREEAPFWRHYAGFREPTPEELGKIPAFFGEPNLRWLIYPLREETHPVNNLDAAIENFRLSQKEDMERLQRTAATFKNLAILVAFLLFTAIVVAGFLLLRQYPLFPAR